MTRITPQRFPDGPPKLPPAIHVSATGADHGATQVAVADVLLKAYRAAAAGAPASCHLPASLLAAIGEVESGSLAGRTINAQHRTAILGPVLNGRNGFRAIPDTDNGRLDGNRRWDRAVGPLQFIPSTWRTFGVDGDGDGVADPQDVDDATATAAAYLCYGGRDLTQPAQLRAAVLAYNDSSAYQQLVMTYQKRFASFGLDRRVDVVGLSVGAPGGPVAGRILPGVYTDPAGAPATAPATGPGRRDGVKKHRSAHRDATAAPSGSSSSAGTPSSGATGGTGGHDGLHPSKDPTKGTSKHPGKDPSGSPSGGSGSTTGDPTTDPTACPPSTTTSADPSAGPSTGADNGAGNGSGDGSADGSGDTATCPPCGTTDDPATDPSADPSGDPSAQPSGDPSSEPGDPATCEPVTEPSTSAAP